MKRVFFLVILMVGVVCSAIAQHYVGAMVDGAIAWQLDKEEYTHSLLSGGPTVGGVYQYQYDEFLVQTGLGISQMWLRQGLDSSFVEREMKDSEDYEYVYRGEVYNRMDQAMVTELTIPLMLGTKKRSFYLLVGAKCAITVYGHSTQTALLNTVGDYGDRYYGVLEHMPQHGFYDAKEISNQDTIRFRPDVRLCAEVGWSWALTNEPVKKGAPRLQAGVFCEYGILNSMPRGGQSLVTDEYTPFMDVKLNHIYKTLNPDLSPLHNLRLGLRVAVIFPVAKGKNPFCRCVSGAATRYSL